MTDVLERRSGNETTSRDVVPQWKPQTSGEQPLMLPPELVPTVVEIAELAKLQPNWDSYGAVPVARDAVVRTLRLFEDLQWRGPLPTVLPTSLGGIHLAWGGDSNAVEIEIPASGPIEVLIDIAGQTLESQVESAMDPSLQLALSWARNLK